ncbi:hypothetical protein B5S28_g4273 [[Candida] boidinii]|nr:hypothetical protein B5S28_g4273 [[Candida] boidinii]OWB64593.1 hypothetical protein B5S29_g5748 [[Candida] boidinii]OWB79147.1 hypothetical protein B5S32_g3360 [[Candida] boidinii]
MRQAEPLVASIDVGTTSTRVILFDKYGNDITKYQIEYSTSAQLGSKRNSPNIFSNEGIAIKETENLEIEENSKKPTLSFPKPGWVECDPNHILANVVQCLGICMINLEIINSEISLDKSYTDLNMLNMTAIDNGEFPLYEVKSIGIANMRETTLIWSKKTGKPYYNGIVWNDTRTLNLMKDLNNNTPIEIKDKIKNICGCPISTYFSALKWLWLYNNVDEIKLAYDKDGEEESDLMFGTIDTWLIYNLTKQNSFMTDITNASRTCFMNLETKDYDDFLLNFWNIDKKRINLPEIKPSSHNFGNFKFPSILNDDYIKKFITIEAKDIIINRLNDIPITGCLGDQSASLVGQLALKKGSAKCTYGTGAFLLYNIGSDKIISQHGCVTTVGYWFEGLDESVDGESSSKPQYCLEGSTAVAGSIVQWLRDNLKIIDKTSDIGPLASKASNSAGVVFVPAFSGLFAPYWDSATTGTIFGLTQYTNASHIARAAVEGVCYQVRAILNSMMNDTAGEMVSEPAEPAESESVANTTTEEEQQQPQLITSIERTTDPIAEEGDFVVNNTVKGDPLNDIDSIDDEDDDDDDDDDEEDDDNTISFQFPKRFTGSDSNIPRHAPQQLTHSQATQTTTAKSSSSNGGGSLSILAVDGGMSKSNEVMQIQADILGPSVKVVRSKNAECTALGAAIAAGIHKDIQLWSSLKEVINCNSVGKQSSVITTANNNISGFSSNSTSTDRLSSKGKSLVDIAYLNRKMLESSLKENNMFVSRMSDEKRHSNWFLWERAVSRARNWLNFDEN